MEYDKTTDAFCGYVKEPKHKQLTMIDFDFASMYWEVIQ